MPKQRKKHGEGSFHLMKTQSNEIAFEDFKNPWSFHHLFTKSDEEVFEWLRNNGLLAKEVMCDKCKIKEEI